MLEKLSRLDDASLFVQI